MRCSSILAVTGCLCLLTVSLCAGVAPAAEIKSSPVNGSDVAEAMGLRISAYACDLPKGKYDAEVWAEQWTRDAKEPVCSVLMQARKVDEKMLRIVIKLPSGKDDACSVMINASGARSKPPINCEKYPVTYSGITTEGKTFELGKDVILTALCDNGDKPYEFSGIEKVHLGNDSSLIIKLRISQSATEH